MSQKLHILVRSDSHIPYFRRSIPLRLRSAFGRREFICSLRTEDAAVAALRSAALLAKTEELLRFARTSSVTTFCKCHGLAALFDAYRDHLFAGYTTGRNFAQYESPTSDDGKSAVSTFRRKRYEFRPSMTARLLARHRAAVLAWDDKWRLSLSYEDLTSCRAELAATEQILVNQLAISDYASAWVEVSKLLAREDVEAAGCPIDTLLLFVARYLDEQLSIIRIRVARLRGESCPTPEAPTGDLDEDEWTAVIAAWKSARIPRPASLYEATLAINKLRRCTSDKSPSDLTLADVLHFRFTLLHEVSRARAKSSLSLVRSTLKAAAADGCVPLTASLSFESVTVEVSEKGIHSYQPFSPAQLHRFFDGPVHTRGLRPAKGGGDAAFWLPLLATFEGMRLEEAGSLTCGSLSQRSGRYWLRIGRSKTLAGVRDIPLHRELEKLGFIDYANTHRAGRLDDEPLFPLLRTGSKKNQTHMFSTWVNEYIDKHVVDDPAYVFHSFRNSFEDAATAAGVAEDVRRALMGHAQAAMTRRYGKKDSRNRRVFPDQALLNAIDLVSYDGLNLERVIASATGQRDFQTGPESK